MPNKFSLFSKFSLFGVPEQLSPDLWGPSSWFPETEEIKADRSGVTESPIY